MFLGCRGEPGKAKRQNLTLRMSHILLSITIFTSTVPLSASVETSQARSKGIFIGIPTTEIFLSFNPRGWNWAEMETKRHGGLQTTAKPYNRTNSYPYVRQDAFAAITRILSSVKVYRATRCITQTTVNPRQVSIAMCWLLCEPFRHIFRNCYYLTAVYKPYFER